MYVNERNLTKNLYETLMERTQAMTREELIRSNGDVNLVDILKIDMLNYLLYLGMADGILQPEEVKYINKLLGYNFDKDGLMRYIQSNHIGIDDF